VAVDPRIAGIDREALDGQIRAQVGDVYNALAVDLVGDANERLLDVLGVVDVADLGADLPVECLACAGTT
jgi:hypothetical protein